MQKLVKLEEMVGIKLEGEEEPEGDIIVGPSGEGVQHSARCTPFFKFRLSLFFLTWTFSWGTVPLGFFCMSELVFLADESSDEEEVKEVTKEEHKIGVAHS